VFSNKKTGFTRPETAKEGRKAAKEGNQQEIKKKTNSEGEFSQGAWDRMKGKNESKGIQV